MERIWLSSYPPGVPADIDPTQYESLAALLEQAFRRHPQDPVSVCMDRWMTYGQLDRYSAALGAYLQSLGLAPGARVAIMLPKDRKSTRLNSSHIQKSRMPSSA